jgi:hypothetical protein
MTEKRQTSQCYIIRILQHFATKLRNITNFVMLFLFCLDLSRSKFCSLGNGSIKCLRKRDGKRAVFSHTQAENKSYCPTRRAHVKKTQRQRRYFVNLPLDHHLRPLMT